MTTPNRDPLAAVAAEVDASAATHPETKTDTPQPTAAQATATAARGTVTLRTTTRAGRVWTHQQDVWQGMIFLLLVAGVVALLTQPDTPAVPTSPTTPTTAVRPAPTPPADPFAGPAWATAIPTAQPDPR